MKIIPRDAGQTINSSVKTAEGETIPPSSFPRVEYSISELKYGDPLVFKSIENGGIVVNGDDFDITLKSEELQMMAGLYYHRLVVYNIQGVKLPSVFNELITIE